MTNRSRPRGVLSEPDIRDVPVYIYALCEPVSGEVRYIGKSANPVARLANHRAGGCKKVVAWIAQLAADGLAPKLCVLEAVQPGQDASARERLAIGRHCAGGARLLNSDGTAAGRGPRARALAPSNQGAAEFTKLTATLTQSQIASSIGVAQSNVSHWMSGRQLPDGVARARLEDTYGIYWRLWDQPLAQESALEEAS